MNALRVGNPARSMLLFCIKGKLLLPAVQRDAAHIGNAERQKQMFPGKVEHRLACRTDENTGQNMRPDDGRIQKLPGIFPAQKIQCGPYPVFTRKKRLIWLLFVPEGCCHGKQLPDGDILCSRISGCTCREKVPYVLIHALDTALCNGDANQRGNNAFRHGKHMDGVIRRKSIPMVLIHGCVIFPHNNTCNIWICAAYCRFQLLQSFQIHAVILLVFCYQGYP